MNAHARSHDGACPFALLVLAVATGGQAVPVADAPARAERPPRGVVTVVVTGAGKSAPVVLVHEHSGHRHDVARVLWLPDDTGLLEPVVPGVTDATGSWTARDVEAGRYVILAGRPGDTTVRRVGTVEIVAGRPAAMAVPLPFDGPRVTGRVTDSGEPASVPILLAAATPDGLQPTTLLARGQSDASGRFALGPVPVSVGPLVIAAQRGTGDPSWWPAKHEDNEIEIGGATLEGSVVDDDGQPLPEAVARAWSEDGRRPLSRGRVRDGRLTVDALPRGARSLVWIETGLDSPSAVLVDVPAVGPVARLEVRMPRGTLSGTARSAVGLPIPRVVLRLHADGAPRLPPLHVEVAEGGSWTRAVSIDRPARYLATANGHGWLRGLVQPGQRLDLEFPPAATVVLDCRDRSGRAAAGVRPWIASAPGMSDGLAVPHVAPSARGRRHEAISDQNGRLVLAAMPLGEVELLAWREWPPVRVALELRPGETKRNRIVLP